MGFSTNYLPRTRKSKILDQSGEALFNGTVGTVIPLQFRTSGNDTSYDISITPEENTSGNLGDYWVIKEPDKLTVYNSGISRTKFGYEISADAIDETYSQQSDAFITSLIFS